MKYKLDLGGWNSVFAVPSAVVDNYIKLASGNALKVLMFFLRYSGKELTLPLISQKTGVSETDVGDALKFWEQAGILSLGEEGTLLPSESLLASETAVPEKAEDTPKPTEIQLKRIELERSPQFKPREIASTVRGSAEIEFVFKQCESLFGRPLKHNEQNTLMIIIEDIGIPAECTLMLVEYCHSIGKATPAYIKKIAADWLEKEIRTIAAAEEEITLMQSYHGIEGQLKTLFEMHSAFSREQKEHIQRWTGTYGFGVDMIDAAYQRTLNQTGKLSFPYMNKILGGWHDKGYRSLADLERDKKPAATQKNEENTASFDIDDVFQRQLRKYGGEA